MLEPPPTSAPGRAEVVFAIVLFAASLGFHFWGARVGWQSKNLPGVEYRQAQTALSAYYIKQDDDFSLAYPTPVLGKPWSVPMEFPLYQWTTVVTSNVTGLGLTKAGRAVSMVCFYLCLPALFLLLGRWQMAPGRRWFVLAVVVTCPLYVFYSRAFLIETMALMFALWFWVAFEKGVGRRHRGWLAVAVLAGTGAGLVKVTTFLLYLLPPAAWAVHRLWRNRRDGSWKIDVRWMSAAMVLPIAAAVWWVWLTDLIKARNPMAHFLSSESLREFNLGTWAAHVSPALWAMKGHIVAAQLTSLPLLLGAGLLLLLGTRSRVRAALACLSVFVAALVLFPVLYAYHDYYYVSNTMLLLLAVGLGVAGLLEQPRWRWLGLAWVVVLAGGQAGRYLTHYYPDQRGISGGGNGLSDALREFTRPDEVVVITGEDWNSMTPYYARRRALMLREIVQNNEAGIDAALAQLAGEKIGALAVTGARWRDVFLLVRRLADRGLAPVPWLTWDDTWVFLREDRWAEVVAQMARSPAARVAWVPNTRAPAGLAGSWRETASLAPDQRRKFDSLQPTPVRFFDTFGPQMQGIDQDAGFSIHPWTRLVFDLPPGTHRLTAAVWFTPGAYHVAAGEDPTDGIGITLLVRMPGLEPRIVRRQLIDPGHNAADRANVPLQFDFSMVTAGEVELVIDPGPNGRDTRDWAWLRGPLVIE